MPEYLEVGGKLTQTLLYRHELSNMVATSHVLALETCLAWIEMCYKCKYTLDFEDFKQRKISQIIFILIPGWNDIFDILGQMQYVMY